MWSSNCQTGSNSVTEKSCDRSNMGTLRIVLQSDSRAVVQCGRRFVPSECEVLFENSTLVAPVLDGEELTILHRFTCLCRHLAKDRSEPTAVGTCVSRSLC